MTEVIRQKFFYILVLFGVVILLTSRYFSEFTASISNTEQIKFIKDFSLAAITMFGTMIAIVGTAQLLPLELENRTIYPILAKPVFRAEFLFGKFLGMAVLLLLTVALMSAIFGGLLFYTERQSIQSAISGATPSLDMTQTEAVTQILKQTRDRGLLKAIALIYAKMLVVSAISLVISTFATSVIFTVIASMIIYICGHLEATARQAMLGGQTLMDNPQAFMTRAILWIITFFVPDLDAFNVADAVVVGLPVPMDLVLKTLAYGAFYTAVALMVAYFIFEEKEI